VKNRPVTGEQPGSGMLTELLQRDRKVHTPNARNERHS
jgi:hypothetical protein